MFYVKTTLFVFMCSAYNFIFIYLLDVGLCLTQPVSRHHFSILRITLDSNVSNG